MRLSWYSFFLSIVSISYSASLCAASVIHSHSHRVPSATQRSQKGNTNAANSTHGLDGLYFASSVGDLGTRGWFVDLTFGTGRGKLYMRPENLDLKKVEVSQVGRVTFRSAEDLGDVVYQFMGQLDANHIVGQFTLVRLTTDGEQTIASEQCVLKRVELRTDGKLATDVSGIYSNIEYNEDSGDLLGEELILFRVGQKLMGVFTSSENDLLPYAAIDIVQSGVNLRFRVLAQTGEENYHGVFMRGRLKLRQTNANAYSQKPQMLVLRTKQVSSIFK